MRSYEVLFHFSASEGHLIEIRRLDPPADAPKDRVYQWLWIDESAAISLQFLGMATAPRQERTFAEASLWFDETHGELRWKGGAVVSLLGRTREEVPRHVQLLIHQHLN